MARVIFVCDGCGKQEDGFFNRRGDAFKPRVWFSRADDDVTQLACSRPCIDKVAAKLPPLECDCQNPDGPSGVRHISMECQVHNENPSPRENGA